MPASTEQIFRIASNQTVYTAGGDVDPQRFVADVNYLMHYASGFAECLSVKTVLYALVEDTASRTAFQFTTSPDRTGSVVNGIFTHGPELPGTLLEKFHDE